MLRIEAKQTPVAKPTAREPVSAVEGMLFLVVLAVSWAIAIAAGWLIWELSPL